MRPRASAQGLGASAPTTRHTRRTRQAREPAPRRRLGDVRNSGASVLEASTRAPLGATVGPGRRTHRAHGLDASQTMKNDAKPWPKPAPRARRRRRSPEHRTRRRQATVTAALPSGRPQRPEPAEAPLPGAWTAVSLALPKGQGFHGNPDLRRRTHRAPTTGKDAFGRPQPRDGPTGPTTRSRGPRAPAPRRRTHRAPTTGKDAFGRPNRATDPPGPRPATKGTTDPPANAKGSFGSPE